MTTENVNGSSSLPAGYAQWIEDRMALMESDPNPAHRAIYQREIDLVSSWGSGNTPVIDTAPAVSPHSFDMHPSGPPPINPQNKSLLSSAPTDYPPTGTGGWGEIDLKIGKDKITELSPLIQEAAEKYGIPPKDLAAIILQEGRGMTAADLRTAGGVAQIGATEIEALRDGRHPGNGNLSIDKHPELAGDYLSDHNQVFGAAAYLAQLRNDSGSMETAIRLYNGGPNAGGNLNDPDYMKKNADALAILDSFGLPW